MSVRGMSSRETTTSVRHVAIGQPINACVTRGDDMTCHKCRKPMNKPSLDWRALAQCPLCARLTLAEWDIKNTKPAKVKPAKQKVDQRKGGNNGVARQRAHNVYIGVKQDKQSKLWQARIGDGIRILRVGQFNTAKEAAKAYNELAKEKYGNQATLNEVG